MKKTTIFAFLLLLNFAFFSCSTVEEETPDLSSDKELVKVSLGSLKINQSDPINGRTAAVPSAVEFIDVAYGPYPEVITRREEGKVWERKLETFAVGDFPDNYTIELEKDREYYISIAAYSLTQWYQRPIYRIYFTVSGRQPVIMSDEINGILANDFFAFSKIFTAEGDMNIDATLNRVSAQLSIQMPEGVNVPPNATKAELSITDTCQDHFGGIYLDLPFASDICDEWTDRFTADLTTSTGLDTVFHIMPLTDSGYQRNKPLEIAVKLFDLSDAVVAEGTAQMDTIYGNIRYNFILDPNSTTQSISIDVDETLGEEVDVIVE